MARSLEVIVRDIAGNHLLEIAKLTAEVERLTDLVAELTAKLPPGPPETP